MPSDDEMPDVFDRLRDKAAVWAEKYPNPPDFELHSDRVLEAQDDDCRVWVTIKDFEVSSIRVDAFWWGQNPPLADVEKHIRDAVNAGLRRYWDEEIEAAQGSSTPMGEVAEGLKQLSGEFREAYERAFRRLDSY